MNKLFSIIAASIAVVACAGTPEAPEAKYADSEIFMTPKKTFVEVTCINHGSVAMFYNGTAIQIDPVGVYGGKTLDYAQYEPADYVFITHEHGDHLSMETIDAVSKEETQIFSNQKSYDTAIQKGEVLANGDKGELNSSISYSVIPAYNTTEGREMFHPKGNGNGYLFNIDGLVVYVSGDTEPLEDMANLGNVDVAFLAVNQPYTMSVEQCIEAAKTINPKVLLPYHLGQTDVDAIIAGLEGTGIDVRFHESLR